MRSRAERRFHRARVIKYKVNAPPERLKEYLKLEFEITPFVVGADYDAAKEQARMRLLATGFTKEDVQYLANEAVGGQERLLYERWLTSFET